MMRLYSTGCPRCLVLEKKLLKADIVTYILTTDVEVMKKKGITSVPALELDDGRILSFKEAVDWINEQEA